SEVQRRIREGVLWAADRYAESEAPWPPDEVHRRRRTQRALRKLAFFPTAAELDIGRALVHTETALEGWSSPLVAPSSSSPLIGPRKWIAGLRSPWRAGYVAATGGPMLSAAMLGAEGVLLRLPPGVVRWMRGRALRFGRVS